MNPLEKLPTLIEDVAESYSLPILEHFLRQVFGDDNFHVKLAGYYNNAYVGVVYYGERTDKVDDLFAYVKSESSKWNLITD